MFCTKYGAKLGIFLQSAKKKFNFFIIFGQIYDRKVFFTGAFQKNTLYTLYITYARAREYVGGTAACNT